MGKGINIEFVSDVKGVLKGTKDIEGALEDVSDALDDVGKDAKKVGEKVGDELKDGGEKGEKAAKDLERKFRDAFDDVKGESRKAGDKVGDDVKRGTGKAGEAVGEFKNEATQNFAETASSFDGSMDSIADLAQSTFGGLAGSIPGIGVALAGLGAAAGAVYSMWKENAEKTEARISAMYDDMLESGNAYLSASYINEGISEILNNGEDAVINYARAQEIAARTGLDLATVTRAYAGDAESAAKVSAELTAQQSALEGQNSSTNAVLAGMVSQLEKVTGNTATAAEKADIYTTAQVGSAEAARDYAAALAGAGSAVADVRAEIDENNKTLTDAEERSLANSAALAGLADDLLGVRSAGREAGASTEEMTRLQGEQETAFYEAAKAAGYGADEARELARRYGLIPRTVATDITADAQVAQAERDLNQAARDRVAQIRAQVVNAYQQYGSGYVPPAQRASGGYVDGPGSGTSDSIPARLSRGEYVLDAQTVQRIGTGRLDQINNGQPQVGGAGQPAASMNVVVNVTADPRYAEQQARLITTRLRDAVAAARLRGAVMP